MNGEIIGLQHWLKTPPGRYLLEWEQERHDELVADLFGYHALQLGMPGLAGLRANRMPHRWLALGQAEAMILNDGRMSSSDDAAQSPIAGEDALNEFQSVTLWAEPVMLPFEESSLDLVLMPHSLELSPDPHAALREVQRVLVPEGRVVISGLNPWSLWGLRQARARLYRKLGVGGSLFLPDEGDFIASGRLRDWLRLLGFELDSMSFGCYRPATQSAAWLENFSWMDSIGPRWWPIFGSAYVIVAVKRVHGMRLLGPSWRNSSAKAAAAPVQVPVAQQGHRATQHNAANSSSGVVR